MPGQLISGLPSTTGVTGTDELIIGRGDTLMRITIDNFVASLFLTQEGDFFNGASQLVKLLVDGKLPALDGSNLVNVPATLPPNVTLQGNSFNGPGQLVQLDGSDRLPAIDGSQLTGLPPSGIHIGDTVFGSSPSQVLWVDAVGTLQQMSGYTGSPSPVNGITVSNGVVLSAF